MNRIVLTILIFTIWGCDTENNVKPLGEEYFIKFYGAIGNQEGVSVKATPDGGYIIGGNSVSEFGGQSDYLLIKVDAVGNQKWAYKYDFNASSEDDFLTDVFVSGSNFMVAGTSHISGVGKMVLFKVDGNGVKGESLIVDATSDEGYVCNGVSETGAGGYLVVGPVVEGDQEGKSLITVVTADFSLDPFHLYPEGAPDPIQPLVYVKALEVINHNNNEIDYLVFCYEIIGGVFQVRLNQFNTLFNSPRDSDPIPYSNTKTVDAIKISDDTYKILTASDDETYLINVSETKSGPSAGTYVLGDGQIVRSENFFKGISVQYSQNRQFLISSDITEENSTSTFSTLVESSLSGVINWERIFGTEFSYKSGKVIELIDGSIVYTGTAGLKDQNKVFLIKMKSNGEMK